MVSKLALWSVVLCLLWLSLCPVCPLASRHAPISIWRPLIRHLVEDGGNGTTIRRIFARPEVQFDPRVMPRKLSHRESRLDYSKFLRPKRIARARSFLHTNRKLLTQIEDTYGVPREIEVAILLVETDLGRYLGPDLAFNILASMAVASNLDHVRPWLSPEIISSMGTRDLREKLKKNSQWSYRELRALLTYSAQNHIDPLTIKGSIFGAIGMCQFMPSSVLRFGVDQDHNGRIDLFSKGDALASMAKYIKAHGWKAGLSRKEQEAVILKYNYSRPYAKTILAVADKLSSGHKR
ncbi:MAG: lytic murein transglycosylase [Nitrospiraceae bacterium]|nr:lytic murein transglycosylase [Nitrospiraceae bacterium]